MNFFQKVLRTFPKGFCALFQKCYINKLTVFLSLFCFRGVLPVEAFVGSGFFVEIGAGGGEEEVAGILTDMVFKPDSKSLISEGPFISGRAADLTAADLTAAVDCSTPNCSSILIPSVIACPRARCISGRFEGGTALR